MATPVKIKNSVLCSVCRGEIVLGVDAPETLVDQRVLDGEGGLDYIEIAHKACVTPPTTQVEKARREVEQQVREHHATAHRALDAKYNLLRVSDRRWSVVRISSVAGTLFGLTDVITFEQVTKPLDFDAAVAALKEKRGAR